MESYEVLDWFEVKGRGWVAYVHHPAFCEDVKLDLVGSPVLLNGVEHLVRGVESHAIWIEHPRPMNIGLLVKEKLT